MQLYTQRQKWWEAASEWASPLPEYSSHNSESNDIRSETRRGRLLAQIAVLVFLPVCMLSLFSSHGQMESAAAILWFLITAIAIYMNRIGRSDSAAQIFLNGSFLIVGLNWMGESNRFSHFAEFGLLALSLCSAVLMNGNSPGYYGFAAALMIAFQCGWHRIPGGYTLYSYSDIGSNFLYHGPFVVMIWGVSAVVSRGLHGVSDVHQTAEINKKLQRLAHESDHNTRIAEHLQKLASGAANIADQDTLLHQIIENVCELSYAGCSILHYKSEDNSPGELCVLLMSPIPGIHIEQAILHLPMLIEQEALLRGEIQRIKIDINEDSKAPDLISDLANAGITNQICVPIKFQNRVIGGLIVWASQESSGCIISDRSLIDSNQDKMNISDPFDDATIRLLNALADHAALALGHSLRHEQMQHEHHRLGIENETVSAQAEELVISNQTLMNVQTILAAQYQTLESANQQLAAMATTDGMTGLANHRSFQEELARQVARTQRSHAAHSLLMMDVDKFKSYNDTYGHPAGDEVLKEVANVIRSVVRDGDFPARYGGEEFGVILPDTELDTAAQIGERIRAAVQAHKFFFVDITVSVGVTQFSAVSPHTTIQRADIALYRAKNEGRNRLVVNPHVANSENSENLEMTIIDGPVAQGSSQRSFADDISSVRNADYSSDYFLTARCTSSNPSVPTLDQWEEPAQRDDLGTESIRIFGGLEGLLQESSVQVLDELIKALDQHSAEPAGHSERLARYTLKLGSVIAESFAAQRETRPLLPNLNPGDLSQFAMGALLHDIGNIGIPENILKKSGKLTKDEWRLVRRHPLVGSEMVARHPLLSRALPIVRYHHERWDGGGYPEGRVGEAIPMGARIFAVCDALDSLTSKKSYRSRMDFAEACHEISQGSGTQFDPDVVAAFITIPVEEWKMLSLIPEFDVIKESDQKTSKAA